MKVNKNTKNNTHKPGKENNSVNSDKTLEMIAEDLTNTARYKLPDGVLRGVLLGHEQDIRQKAILLALTWDLRGSQINEDGSITPWHSVRAIAGALTIIKRATIREIKKETENLSDIPEMQASTCHPVMIRACEWPTPLMRDLCRKAIRMSLRAGKISPLNAAVAEAVYVEGIQASDLARRIKVNRSNIYQHLFRVKSHLTSFIETMEVPLEDIM